MGIDYGARRIGIALSDEGGGFAFAHSVIERDKNTINKIKKIYKENNVKKIILGESVDYKDRPNLIMKEIEKFKKVLEKEIGLAIDYQKEILTTKEAEREQGKIKKIDASAAALILRSYLEKKKVI
jgi:putative Holliday junction resolvase